MGKSKSAYQRSGSKAAAQFSAKNKLPSGVQAHHWNKVLQAFKAGMPFSRMNKSFSPMNSRNAQPNTTMLTSGPTKFTVHEKVVPQGNLSKPMHRFGNEHTFADRFMIKREQERLNANPNINKQDAVEMAGGTAKWKMTGHPGNVSKKLLQQVDLSKVKSAISKFVNRAKATKPAAKAAPGGQTKPAGKATPKPAKSSSPKPSTKPARTSFKVAPAPKGPSAAPKPSSGSTPNSTPNV